MDPYQGLELERNEDPQFWPVRTHHRFVEGRTAPADGSDEEDLWPMVRKSQIIRTGS